MRINKTCSSFLKIHCEAWDAHMFMWMMQTIFDSVGFISTDVSAPNRYFSVPVRVKDGYKLWGASKQLTSNLILKTVQDDNSAFHREG